jgi:hypothetical protein
MSWRGQMHLTAWWHDSYRHDNCMRGAPLREPLIWEWKSSVVSQEDDSETSLCSKVEFSQPSLFDDYTY